MVDGAIEASRKVDNKHTLNGQDLNNFAPRFGAAYQVNEKLVLRGGYGLFYDRPSAAFINTVFSNYPFLREVEITVPSGNVPIATAFSSTPTNHSFERVAAVQNRPLFRRERLLIKYATTRRLQPIRAVFPFRAAQPEISPKHSSFARLTAI